jgi:enolase
VRQGAEIFHALKKGLKAQGLSTGIGDEGGFAPALTSTEAALDAIMAAIEAAGYTPGRDTMLALDCAATEYYRDGVLCDGRHGDDIGRTHRLSGRAAGRLSDLFDRGWLRRGRLGRLGGKMTEILGERCQLVGDDLFVTNPEAAAPGDRSAAANALLVKVNQIGTLTETLEAVEIAQRASFACVMSHRSGETEDATIADLAVATNCGQIKTGSLSRSDRLAKYNQLIRIEEQLGEAAEYAGRSILGG